MAVVAVITHLLAVVHKATVAVLDLLKLRAIGLNERCKASEWGPNQGVEVARDVI